MTAIDVTDPAVQAWMLDMFQAPIDDGELTDRNAALNNLRAEVFRLRTVLHKIAYEPFGPSEATDAEVLRDITALARETLK